MKLLFLMHDRPKYPSGPIINYLRLLPRLVEKQYEVYLLAIYHQDCPNARELSKMGVHLYSTPYTYSETLVHWILQTAELIQPDIFIPDVSTQGCFAGKWLLEAGIPVINTHRSDDELNWGKAIYFSDPSYNWLLSGIVSVSSYLQNELKNRMGSSSILHEVIPSGVEVYSNKILHTSQRINIVFSGRLVEKQKRIMSTISAFNSLCNNHKEIYITIIGDGPERINCEKLVSSEGNSDRFQFTGRLLGRKYKEALSNNHIIVLLSDFEGTPGALLDGMSCGLIPVALRYNGIDELIEHEINGIIVEDRCNSFINAIAKLIDNIELRTRLSNSARLTIEQRYSIEIIVDKWVLLFSKVLQLKNLKKRRFVAPEKIILPKHNPILLEDNRLPNKSIMRILFDLIPYSKNIRKMLK